MSKPELFQAINNVFSLGMFAACIIVYTRVGVRLFREGGRVRVADFQVPELFVAVVLGSYFIFTIWMNARQGGDAAATINIDLLILSAGMFVVYTAGLSFFLAFGRKISYNQAFGLSRVPPLKIAAWALGLLACALPLIRIASYATQITLTKDQMAQQAVVELFRELSKKGNYSAIGEFCIATVIVAPVCEEFLFRGFFYGVGKRFLGAIPAGILGAFFFAAFHSNLSSLAPLFVLALCFTLAYERTGSLLVPIGMHALFNSLNLLFLFGQVQGWFPEL